MQVIILAAGQGTRLGSDVCPKVLTSFEQEPVLVRLIRQLTEVGLGNAIKIIIGYQQHTITAALKQFSNIITFILNEQYATDKNALSLYLALKDIHQPVLIIEADVILSDISLQIIKQSLTKSSILFTRGKFQPYQIGGVIKSNQRREIIDIQILQQFSNLYADYNKNLGILYLGEQELETYKTILTKQILSLNQFYYIDFWLKNLDILPCKEVDLFPYAAGSFNNWQEFKHCQTIFQLEKTI